MNRVHTYQITRKAKENELNFIKITLHDNEYNIKLRMRHPTEHKHNVTCMGVRVTKLTGSRYDDWIY
jgi:hypothetical protein